jgi:hypothetical protein
MSRVVPSQIIEFIDSAFPFARTGQQYNVDIQYKGRVSALLRLADELPDELMRMDSTDYNQFVLSVSTIRSTLQLEPWISRGHLAPLYDRELGGAISDLRRSIATLDDQQIAEATTGLAFIKDSPLRESIRADIAFADQAFSGAEWKAATVLAGAAAEALLLWAITAKKTKAEVKAAARSASIPNPSADPNNWGLDGYIKVARALDLIKDTTAKQAALAKDFRNLIHPGRSARLKEVCDRGTAHSALAAVEFIVRDLS